MKSLVKNFAKNESGATAIEYGLIASLISVVIITAATTLGGRISTIFTTISDSLVTTTGG